MMMCPLFSNISSNGVRVNKEKIGKKMVSPENHKRLLIAERTIKNHH